MRKSDYELLSNEELQIMLADQATYSTEEIACAKQILKERKISGHIAGNATENNLDKEASAPAHSDRTSEQLRDIQNNIRIIRNCAIFFVIITAISLIVAFVCGINLMSALSKATALIK